MGGRFFICLPQKKKNARSHPAAQTQRSEGGYKLMLNASSKEQQALKPIARCTKITVDLTHEEQPLFYAQNKNTGGSAFTVGLWIIQFSYHSYHCRTMTGVKLNMFGKVLLVWHFIIFYKGLHIWNQDMFVAK